jgi:hypothetical protein
MIFLLLAWEFCLDFFMLGVAFMMYKKNLLICFFYVKKYVQAVMISYMMG